MTIRRKPEDFVVEELLADTTHRLILSRPSAYALFLLEKKSTTTPQAISELARQLGVRPMDLAFVGLKDKHAVTSQFVTVRRSEAPQEVGGGAWRARRLGWMDQPLAAEMVAGNRFVIVVRDLSHAKARQMEGLAAKLRHSHPGESEASTDQVKGEAGSSVPLWVVNYFGDQRFGSARHREGFAAPLLLQGDYLGALKLLIATPSRKDKQTVKEFRRLLAQRWGDFAGVLAKLPRCPERRAVEILARDPDRALDAFAALPYFTQQMCVYSYQSYLWNRMARLLLEETCGQQGYEVDDAFGAMLFVPAKEIPGALKTLDLPVLGRNTELREPWQSAAVRVLREQGIANLRELRLPGLRRPFFGEAPRQLFMPVSDFKLGPLENDPLAPGRKLRRLSFELPRGGYATVVLRALGQ